MMNGRYEAYVNAAVEGEVARLAAAHPGERNQILFKSSASLAGLGLLEGHIIQHLKPVAENIGLHGKEFYSTLKSGVKAGHARPRVLPVSIGPRTTAAPADQSVSQASWPQQTSAQQVDRSAFFAADEGPPVLPGEIRRHVYRRSGLPVRIKVKHKDGYANWYRVVDHGQTRWQPRKPDEFVPCPYVGALNPFDPELADDELYWPEGEKDCDTLGRLAFPTFTFGGAGDGLPNGCAEYVRGRHLVILADNDAVGHAHAEKKAALAAGIAATIKIVEFPELPAGGDVSDYLKAHSSDELQQRVREAAYWQPPDDPPPGGEQDRALLTCELSDIAPEQVEWLWPGRLALGKLTMIAGEPGLGKSQLGIAVAAAVTIGGRWPDSNLHAPRGSVIILSAEDGLADTIRPRFDAAGGDPTKVGVVRAVGIRGSNARRSFDLAADLELLEAEVRRRGDVRLVQIDPVSSYLGKIDSHKNADVRSVLEPLGEMADRLRIAVMAITHLSKGDGKAINRFVGSIAFVAAARTAFAVVSDPDDEAGLRRLFLQVKNNIAPPQRGLAFRLLQREVAPGILASAIDWDDTQPVNLQVDQALQGRKEAEAGTATQDACEFLQELLSSGPVDVLDVEAEARAAAMLSDSRRLKESKPFRVAANQLGIIRKRAGFGPGARIRWELPSCENSNVAGRA